MIVKYWGSLVISARYEEKILGLSHPLRVTGMIESDSKWNIYWNGNGRWIMAYDINMETSTMYTSSPTQGGSSKSILRTVHKADADVLVSA